MDDFHSLARRRRRSGIRQRLLRRAKHERERRSELMAHVREELRLRPIDLGERLGPTPLVFVGPGSSEARRDLTGDELHETGIIVVEWPIRIDSRHEIAGGTVLILPS